MMKILFLIAVFAMGIYDGGDITGAVVLGLLFLPGVFEKKRSFDYAQGDKEGGRHNVKSGKRIYDCGSGVSNEF